MKKLVPMRLFNSYYGLHMIYKEIKIEGKQYTMEELIERIETLLQEEPTVER